MAIAWGCAIWSPVRSTLDPFPNPTGFSATIDPDGDWGFHYIETGIGWQYMTLRGYGKSVQDVIWNPPWGGTYHRTAGWPWPALRSRVEVLDSQAANRVSEGDGVPRNPILIQRLRWQLPLREIVFRGVASKDLPAWVHAESNRRLPLVPLPLWLLGDTLLYGVAIAGIALLFRPVWRRCHRDRRGFQVLTGGAA